MISHVTKISLVGFLLLFAGKLISGLAGVFI